MAKRAARRTPALEACCGAMPDPLVAEIDAESRRRKVSKSDVVRERLQAGAKVEWRRSASLDAIGDLIGAVMACQTI